MDKKERECGPPPPTAITNAAACPTEGRRWAEAAAWFCFHLSNSCKKPKKATAVRTCVCAMLTGKAHLYNGTRTWCSQPRSDKCVREGGKREGRAIRFLLLLPFLLLGCSNTTRRLRTNHYSVQAVWVCVREWTHIHTGTPVFCLSHALSLSLLLQTLSPPNICGDGDDGDDDDDDDDVFPYLCFRAGYQTTSTTHKHTASHFNAHTFTEQRQHRHQHVSMLRCMSSQVLLCL